MEHSATFNEYWNFCKVSSGYSGVATFSKHLPINVIEDMPEFKEHNKEGRIITLEFDQFYVVNLYKPNSGDNLIRLDYRLEYEECLKSFIKKLQEKKPVIVVGDMNVANDEIDLKNPKQNQGKACFTKEERQKFKELLNECNLVDSFRELHPKLAKYSFWSYRMRAREKNVGWRLDYILVDRRLKVQFADIMNEVYGSDHCPVIAKIDLL
jgi:exodeoxyribonuclease-3